MEHWCYPESLSFYEKTPWLKVALVPLLAPLLIRKPIDALPAFTLVEVDGCLRAAMQCTHAFSTCEKHRGKTWHVVKCKSDKDTFVYCKEDKA